MPLRQGFGLLWRLRPRGGPGHLRTVVRGRDLPLHVLAGLGELVDQSLIRQAEEHDDVRFRMLETIREFAAEQLVGRGEDVEIHVRHASWFTDLVQRAAPHLTGTDRAGWLDLV